MFNVRWSPANTRFAIILALLPLIFLISFVTLTAQPAHAQTYRRIYNFTDGLDGEYPNAGLTMDAEGNLYGTTWNGGRGCGTVFQLKHQGSNWVFNLLHEFTGGSDGCGPDGVIFGSNSTLYGTTGGGGNGFGTVFNLMPSASGCKTALCPWTENVLYRFTGGLDGAYPGDLIFDEAGNIYGITALGGSYNGGVAYELTPSGSGYTETVIYNFGGVGDGFEPQSGLTFDNAGNLYGATWEGGDGYNNGTVFELSPSGSGWAEKILYSFQGGNDGSLPFAGVIFDQSGNLYGATSSGGTGGGGTVFEMSPSGEGWTFTVLYSFTGGFVSGPRANLVMDGAGNIYGTTYGDGAYGKGSVFKLTPTSNPPWTYTSLHDFPLEGPDGAYPISNVTFDPSGNLYGTATVGGSLGFGIVWEITP